MEEANDRNKALQEVNSKYQRYLKDIEAENCKFRECLQDTPCQQIYDKLFSQAKLNDKVEFRFKELLELTRMTRPTLISHLKHLEEKKFLIKNVQTRYKKIYRLNVIKMVAVCKIKKTITRKEKLELINLAQLRTGDIFTPIEPVKSLPIFAKTHDSQKSGNKKTRQYFKAHKNKLAKVKDP
ncbi:MAG: hypothetical protein NWE96_08625 [Candidatus Bathyarchaeota archaeon]|nr:hypothetical protein [Candidatus Bathyarchaeota archaeon]